MPTDPFIWAFGVTLILGVIVSLILLVLWKSAQKALSDERGAHAATSQNLVATQAAVKVSETGRTGETARLEAIITGLQAELAAAPHSTDPEAQRARLAKLSGG